MAYQHWKPSVSFVTTATDSLPTLMKFSAKLFAAAAVAATAISSPALAEDKGIYVLGGIGVSQVDADAVSMDQGFNFELGFGYDFGNDLRSEFTWERNELDGVTVLGITVPADASTDTFLVSLYKDFSNDTKITPFIGGGIGTTGVNDSTATWNSAFTYALSAGASYEASESTDIYVKFSTLNATPSTGGTDVVSNAVSAKLGVRYSF